MEKEVHESFLSPFEQFLIPFLHVHAANFVYAGLYQQIRVEPRVRELSNQISIWQSGR